MRPSHRNLPSLLLLVLLPTITALIITGLGFLLWANAQTPHPGDALARAEQLYKQQEWAAAQKLLPTALKQAEFRDWALLLTAQLSEKRGALPEALSSYEAVSRQSAASVDARLGAVRVARLLSRPPSEWLAEELTAIEHALVRNRRQELLSDLLFERAKLLEAQGQYLPAQTVLNELRDRYPRAAAQARTALSDLEIVHPELVTEASAPTLLTEARLLAKEGEITQALDRVALARSRLAAGSQAALEARLVEEEVLRRGKRSDEADSVLNEVAAGALPRIADEALFRLAKNAWNRNDNAGALQTLSRLSSPRPLSPTLAEALYTKGRIQEELKQFDEARQTYLSIIQFMPQAGAQTMPQSGAQSGIDGEMARRALRRVAWLSLLTSQWTQCAEEFKQLAALATGALQSPLAEKLIHPLPLAEEDRQARKFALSALDDLRHGMYWQSHCLTPDSTQQQRRNDLLISLKTSDPRGYYGALATKALEQQTGERIASAAIQSTAIQSDGQTRLDTGKEHPPLDSCFTPIPDHVSERINRFRAHSLGELAEREVDWAFGDGASFPLPPAATRQDQVRREFARVELFLVGGQVRRGLTLAEERLSDLALLGESYCAPELSNLSYPLVYRELFDSQTEVPPSLLYAIARTESYFDPQAVSVVGAQGMVQLMPETARAEGLGAEEDIFSPAVNLRLGARHLRRLMQEHDSTPPFAIAAYNGGSTAVKRWRSRYPGIPLEQWIELIGFPETNRYVKRVLVAQERYRTILGEPPLRNTPFSPGATKLSATVSNATVSNATGSNPTGSNAIGTAETSPG